MMAWSPDENDPVRDDETADSDPEGRADAQEESEPGPFRGSPLRRDSPPAAVGRLPWHQWMVSYSDFMTILMIFFLAMYGHAYLTKSYLLEMVGARVTYSDFTKTVLDLRKTLGEDILVREDVEKVVIQLASQVLFPSGSADLNPAAERALAEIAASLAQVRGDVIVEGHTDRVPILGGRYRSNWELSAARSFSVIAALTRAGVDPGRLAAWGFGENRPLVPEVDGRGAPENRRIHIVLLKRDEERRGG